MPSVGFNDEEMWARFIKAFDLADKQSHAPQQKVRDIVRDATIAKEYAQQRAAEKLEYEQQRAVEKQQPEASPFLRMLKMPSGWPLTQDMEDLIVQLGFNPQMLKPRNTATPIPPMKALSKEEPDEEMHNEQKKFMIRDGFQYWGMDDPSASFTYALRDIEEGRLWSTINDRAKTAHNIALGKYRQWKVRQALMPTS